MAVVTNPALSAEFRAGSALSAEAKCTLSVQFSSGSVMASLITVMSEDGAQNADSSLETVASDSRSRSLAESASDGATVYVDSEHPLLSLSRLDSEAGNAKGCPCNSALSAEFSRWLACAHHRKASQCRPGARHTLIGSAVFSPHRKRGFATSGFSEKLRASLSGDFSDSFGRAGARIREVRGMAEPMCLTPARPPYALDTQRVGSLSRSGA